MDKPTASAQTLMEQACSTAKWYLAEGLEHVKMELEGESFTEDNHSKLLSAYMIAAALDYHAAATLCAGHRMAEAIEALGDTLSRGV